MCRRVNSHWPGPPTTLSSSPVTSSMTSLAGDDVGSVWWRTAAGRQRSTPSVHTHCTAVVASASAPVAAVTAGALNRAHLLPDVTSHVPLYSSHGASPIVKRPIILHRSRSSQCYTEEGRLLIRALKLLFSSTLFGTLDLGYDILSVSSGDETTTELNFEMVRTCKISSKLFSSRE